VKDEHKVTLLRRERDKLVEVAEQMLVESRPIFAARVQVLIDRFDAQDPAPEDDGLEPIKTEGT
jgi:hypothetical protein